MKQILIDNKNDLKYKEYEVRGDKITILGIGKKSIKYTTEALDEPKFAFYNTFEGKLIATELIKSFKNELWNEEIRACIEAQKKYCKENKAPHFAPEDGFCYSCGKQIYADYHEDSFVDHGESIEYASTNLITGCPHCHRSYCD